MNLLLERYLKYSIESTLTMMRNEGMINQEGLKKINKLLRDETS